MTSLVTDLDDERVERAAKAMHESAAWSSFWSFDEARELARAALTAAGEGWRPIETAPKDGTKIILAKIIPASEEREAAIWWACMGHWRVESPLSGTAGKIRRQAAWTDGMDNLGDPTHWTPVLPPPPPPTE
jgi:hypothetical protein